MGEVCRHGGLLPPTRPPPDWPLSRSHRHPLSRGGWRPRYARRKPTSTGL